MPTTIVLVRHGETDWNRERRYQGHADVPLNETGRRQAHDLADLLASERVDAVYTSPLRRASETAGIVAAQIGLEPRVLEALREIDVGDWEGLTIDDVRAQFPERADVAGHSGFPNGETDEDLDARVVPALVDLSRTHADETVLGVTHAGPIRAALASATQLSHEESRAALGPLANCAVFRFAVRDGRLAQTG